MTLLDTVIGSALMLLVFVGIAAAFQLSVEVVTNNRVRAGAIALANERMEYLRSLSYTQIGVIGGIPAGNVPQEETVFYNAISYTRRTMVAYSDDPGDGLGAADVNGIIADYKTIRVEINWQSRQGERGLTLVGRVSPFGIETAVPGGVLTMHVVNEASESVPNAQIDIINTETVPAINIRTYTNAEGAVTFIGAPAASNYQITVSKPGYSSAQTYSVTAENPNPNPRHLTVANNQTTSANFTIDHVSTKTIQTFMAIQEQTWTDSMSDDSKIDTMASTTIAGGVARLSDASSEYLTPGTMRSIAIAPSDLYGWKTLTAEESAPGQTEIRFRIFDGSGSTLIPESQLPGNAAGFATTSISLSGISTTTYPQLRIGTTLTSADPLVTPSLNEYAVLYDYGPVLLPNLSFGMRGSKSIGNNPTVYKYDQILSSGPTASLTISNVEADTYTLSIGTTTGYTLSESCAPQPQVLAPASQQATRLYVLPASTHSLLVDVRSNAGALLEGASVNLTKTLYDVTIVTSSCGQVFFGNLTQDTYTAAITASGYQQYTTNVNIDGAIHLPVVLQMQ